MVMLVVVIMVGLFCLVRVLVGGIVVVVVLVVMVVVGASMRHKITKKAAILNKKSYYLQSQGLGGKYRISLKHMTIIVNSPLQ